MPPDSEVTRGEFDMLRQQVADNATRLNSIDLGGTRGVSVLQLQITEMAKDVQEVKTQQTNHVQEHVTDAVERARQRRSAWRWGITTFIAFLALVEGPLLYLVTSSHH